MLHYELTKSYIDFICSLPYKERGTVLWNSQSILSMASGYLKMKVADVDEERSIFRIAENTFVFVQLNYSFVRLLGGVKSVSVPSFTENEDAIIASQTVKDLVSKDGAPLPKDDFEVLLESNYFTPWFIKLFASLPKECREALGKKDTQKEMGIISEAKTKSQPAENEKEPVNRNKENNDDIVVKRPPVKQAVLSLPSYQSYDLHQKKKVFKRTIDGDEYEKAILFELQKAYEKRASRKAISQKGMQPQALRHVRFAPKEIVIAYDDEGTCLDLLLRKTKQNGCRLSEEDWLILLANTVEESFANEIEERYPNHVMYTDNPNKGQLRFAIIVKKKPKIDESESSEIKRVKTKVASFEQSIPSGAYDNIDEEDNWDTRSRSSTIKLIKSKVANFAPTLPSQVTEDSDEFDSQIDDDGFWIDEEEIPNEEDYEEETGKDEQEKPYPKHWHCYLCGKKKLYSGEPAETIKLGNGSVAYLCKKHRGKM